MQWSQTAPDEIRPQGSVISGPWFGRVLRDAGMEERCVEVLLKSLRGGVDFAGEYVAICHVSRDMHTYIHSDTYTDMETSTPAYVPYVH